MKNKYIDIIIFSVITLLLLIYNTNFSVESKEEVNIEISKSSEIAVI